MNNLPSWINPALIQANIEALWNSNWTKTNPIVEDNMKWFRTWVEKVTWSQEKKKEIVDINQRSPSNSIKSLILFLWLEFEDFKWKNVLDLWWWFWWLAKNIVDFAKKITIVDPIFNEDIEKALRKNIEDQEYFLYLRKESLKNDRTKSHIHAQIFEWENVLEEMKWWLNYNPDTFQNVIRNPYFAENIEWVENESEDFVFCNYVLSKETIDIEKAVKEISRILKSGWKLIYSDYERNEKLLDEFKKYFKLEIIYDKDDWIIIICTK